MRDQAADEFLKLQDRICAALESLDGAARFHEDHWQRTGGGGGRTRVLISKGVFEKAGVNFSEVHGQMTEEFASQIPGSGREFYATGISLVLHPYNPHVPTVHANFRFIAKGDRQWFGGGADLTPYYLNSDDTIHFHRVWKVCCDRHRGVANYARMKADCDRYFFLPHRGEARGVGGIFFDYLEGNLPEIFGFVRDAGGSFLNAYVPIVERRRNDPFTESQREWQLFRRGRYVEFNLLYDRGTIFGLKTGGRTESILMSLPPLVRWGYDVQPSAGSPEAELIEVLRSPRDWIAATD